VLSGESHKRQALCLGEGLRIKSEAFVVSASKLIAMYVEDNEVKGIDGMNFSFTYLPTSLW